MFVGSPVRELGVSPSSAPRLTKTMGEAPTLFREGSGGGAGARSTKIKIVVWRPQVKYVFANVGPQLGFDATSPDQAMHLLCWHTIGELPAAASGPPDTQLTQHTRM